MESIIILDKKFRSYIASEKIEAAVDALAARLNREHQNKNVLFLVVLNGAFMLASDLMKRIRFNCRVSFVKLTSYEGMNSTGTIKELIGIHEELRDKTVIVVEDVVDTGATLQDLIVRIKAHNPAEIKVLSLLFKKGSYAYNRIPDYIGFEIPNDFVVGYGLDYKGYGRNLKDIYTVVESN